VVFATKLKCAEQRASGGIDSVVCWESTCFRGTANQSAARRIHSAWHIAAADDDDEISRSAVLLTQPAAQAEP
jgi:hypothetical protein